MLTIEYRTSVHERRRNNLVKYPTEENKKPVLGIQCLKSHGVTVAAKWLEMKTVIKPS